MLLNDTNNIHWKSKLIDGLSNLLAERVRKTLRDKNNGTISYHNYTYGNLINSCIQEGLALYNDLKLRHQLKVQRLSERKQLGEFCRQFAINGPKPPNIRNLEKDIVTL